MVDRVPLSDIPGLYAGDPQEGLKQVMRHLPGATAEQRRWGDDAFVTTITSPYGLKYSSTVIYEPPKTYDEDEKARRIEEWLKGLVHIAESNLRLPPGSSLPQVLGRFELLGTTEMPSRPSVPPVNPVKLALAEARSTPEPIAPVARADAGDRLLSALKAKRNGTPNVR